MHFVSKVVGLSAMQRSRQKKLDDVPIAHFYESPIRTVYASTDYTKPITLDSPRQLVIFCIKRKFIETADFVKPFLINQHKHSGGEGFVQPGEPLRQLIAAEQKMVHPDAVPAKDVRRYTMQRFLLYQIKCAAQQCRMRQFNIRVQKEKVTAVGASSPVIAAD